MADPLEQWAGSCVAWELSGPGDISHQAGVTLVAFQGPAQLPYACVGDGVFPANGVEYLWRMLKPGLPLFLSVFMYVCVFACICKGLYKQINI